MAFFPPYADAVLEDTHFRPAPSYNLAKAIFVASEQTWRIVSTDDIESDVALDLRTDRSLELTILDADTLTFRYYVAYRTGVRHETFSGTSKRLVEARP